jgi:hypothetical protein
VHAPDEEKSDDSKTVFMRSRKFIIFLSTIRKLCKEIIMQKGEREYFQTDMWESESTSK